MFEFSGAKRRAEGVDLAERAGEDLGVQLPADGQVRGAMKKVVRKINHRALFGEFRQIERRDFEHLAGAFAVAGGDDRRMDVKKALLLKKIVNRPADLIPQPGDRSKGVGPRPQMSDRAQEFPRVVLFLERISFRIGPAVNHDTARA